MTGGSDDPRVDPRREKYEQEALSWDAVVGSDAKRANAIFDRLHAMAKEMRQTEKGKDALADLRSHPSPGVRLLAATECLTWDPAGSVPVLESLVDAGGLHGVSAKYTLRAFHDGTLDLDW